VDAGHYLKTELQIVSVSDLDGEMPAEIPVRNILREKTFNSELNSLVNKIFNNEKMSEEPLNMYEEFDSTEKNSLLLKYEKLIYQLKHSGELPSISSHYNPFDTDINVYDDIDDTADYVKAGLMQGGFSKYQILKYNFNDKAYRSDINYLNESYSSGMFYSINDPLLKKINESPDGFLIDPNLIKSDPFFSKKFLNLDAGDVAIGIYYIIKISSLFKDLIETGIFAKRISKFEEFLSPLLLIELEPSDKYNLSEILKLLKETAALPLILYFLKNSIKFGINNSSYEDILLMIELFIKSSVNTELKSYIFSLKDCTTKDNIFIFKYFLSKMRRILKRNSLVLRISINRAVIITTESGTGDIHNLLERVNYGKIIIEMQQINYNEYLNNKEFVNLFL